MATRRPNPNQDLSDLKARLGLGKTLEQRPQEPEPEPEPPLHMGGEATFNPGQQGYPPPSGMPPGYGAPPAPQRPAFAGPAGGPRKPPQRPDPRDTWSPPPSDPTAAMDVSVKASWSIGQLLGAAGTIFVLALFFGGVGFFFGNARQQRALFDAQSNDARRVLEVVETKLKVINELSSVAEKHDGLAPDEAVVKALFDVNFVLEPEEIASGKLLLGPEITALLMRLSADSKLAAEMLNTHRLMTTKIDQKELEDLSKANEALKAAGFAVIFDATSFVDNYGAKTEVPPVEGKLMIFDNFDTVDKDGEKLVKLRSPSSGQVREWSLKKLVLLDKTEMLKSGGPNALKRYESRHKDISTKLKEMTQYGEKLVTELDKLANRGSAPILSF